MQRFIALLRAINVGGRTVKMERLRTLFEELEFTNVATFIASGNVIFESSARKTASLEQRIEKHLKDSLGYEVETFIRTAGEIARIAQYEPFPAAELATPGSSLYVSFLHDPLSAETTRKLMEYRTHIDDFHVHDREVYWFCRTKISESPLFSGSSLEKTLRMPATMRNITTVRKLAAKYPPKG